MASCAVNAGQVPQCRERQREGNQGAENGEHQQQCPIADIGQDNDRAVPGPRMAHDGSATSRNPAPSSSQVTAIAS